MADIKIYGRLHNQDGNFLVSPLEVAGVKDDGSIYEGAATKTNNIISYINSKTDAIKTGIKSLSISGTITPEGPSRDITIECNDGTKKIGNISISTDIIKDVTVTVEPDVSFGKTTTLAKLNFKKWSNDTLTKNIDIKLPSNNDVGVAWNNSQTAINYKNTVTTAISTAKSEATKYTDTQIKTALSSVYKVQGSKTIQEITTEPKWNKGDVIDVSDSTGFFVGGDKYPPHTNILIKEDLNTSLVYIEKEGGFDKEYVDPLGGMVDTSQITDDVANKYITKDITWDVNTVSLSLVDNPMLQKIGTLKFKNGKNDSTKVDINLKVNPIPKNTFEAGSYMNITQNANNFVFGIDYEGLQTAFNIINLNRSIENLETNKADVSTVNGVSGRVTTLEGTIKNKADNATVTSLESRVSALESLLSLG